MSGGFSAKRYAEAVFQIARERDELDKWQAELAELVKLREDAALAAWLDSPKVGLEVKRDYLEATLKDVSPLTRNLAYMLIRRGAFEGIAAIAAAYGERLDDSLGRATALVSSAAPLDAAEESGIKNRLSEITGKQIVLRTEVDPSLVGGFVARVGDKLLDGSTRNNLRALKRSLAENK